MSNLKLNQLFKKKNIVMIFFIMCSLLISEKALAVWGVDCCTVDYIPKSQLVKEGYVRFYFKFMEYSENPAHNNSFLESFIAEFSINGGKKYIHLITASSEDQSKKTWAQINLQNKRIDEKIVLFPKHIALPNSIEIFWKDHMMDYCLKVGNHPIFTNQTWLLVHWYCKADLLPQITHVRIFAKWNPGGQSQTIKSKHIYPIIQMKSMLNSKSLNFSILSLKKEIRTEDTTNTIKAYKQANVVVVKGALNEKVQVYTTAGKLVKSIIANRNMLPIPLPANQLYIVNIGQISYKLGL